ncbi:MAG: multidrug transporter subunit MdtD [Burkholderiaceae bacterium]|jgi:EmrB/QacA subfamily drug resistance transporter|nr:multidrug transporter subunit MdtD [Burkholderiaceae bacterium]
MSPSSSPNASNALLWLVAIGFFMQSLDGTIVNTALPSMARSLGESPLHMQAVVVAYALTMAAVIPASGWLADRFGTRRVFLWAIVVFTVGSAACAASPTLQWLVAARVAQGLGGALLLPVGRLAVLRAFPREQFLQAMSFVAVPGLIGPLLGPALGGWLVEAASWHWVFLINLPVGLAGALATLRYMPQDDAQQQQQPGRFDLGGFVMLVTAMLSISLALDGLGGLGLGHALVALLLVLGLSMLTAYWLHALKAPQPLFAPRLFGIQSFRVGLLGNLFARIGSGAMPYLIPLLMQLSMGYSPAQAGMLMLPMAAAGIAAKRFAAPAIERLGYRRVLIANTALLGGMIASFALMTPGQPLALRIAQMAIFGAINSLQMTAMNTVTLKDLDSAGASGGNSMLSMVQMLGMSLGVSVAAAMLTTFANWFGAGATAAASGGPDALSAFRAALLVIGALTIASASIFWQLAPESLRPQERRVRRAESSPLD